MNNEKESFLKRKNVIISFKRYGIDAMGSMALGLFASLLIGTIINTIGQNICPGSFVSEKLLEIGGYATSVTGAAMALAELCFDTLMEEGVKAKIALEAGVCTPAVEKIIEANTLLSGIGFESAGLAGAHAIHNGLTVLEECHHMYHGEKVAFGTLAQLVLENVPHEELEEIIMWCIEVGLPVTLEELGAGNVTDEQLMQKMIHFTICHSQLHRRVYLQRSRQQMHMADIILERNKQSIMFFVQK